MTPATVALIIIGIIAMATLLVFLGVYVVTQSKSRAQLEAEKQKQNKDLKTQ